jgi:hypothetical protein
MHTRNYRDIIGGLALVTIGLFAAIYALASLDLGNVMRMGPGMIPAMLGVLLVLFGMAIFVPALLQQGTAIQVDWRPAILVSASILAFALIVGPFGMVPAIVVLTLIATRADSSLSILSTVILATGLALGAYLIFSVGLGAPLRVFNWPF